MENLGYKELVKEVLNKEFKLNLQEEIRINDRVYDLVDLDENFFIEIKNSSINPEQLEKTEELIREVSLEFKKPAILVVFPVVLPEKDSLHIIDLTKRVKSITTLLFFFGIKQILECAINSKINFKPYLPELFRLDSNVTLLLAEKKYQNYINSFDESSDSNSQDLKSQTQEIKVDLPSELLSYKYSFVTHKQNATEQLGGFVKNNIWKSRDNRTDLWNVQKGDIILAISFLDTPNHKPVFDLNIDAVGVVFKRYNGTDIGVVWKHIKSFFVDSFDIHFELLNEYQVLSKKQKHKLLELFSKSDESIGAILNELKEKGKHLLKQENFDKTKKSKKHDTSLVVEDDFVKDTTDKKEKQLIEPLENITRLAGIQSDSDDGTDYLDIENDVLAFARVMCAENFKPPLAIGLLGKWGAGKSFFMRQLQKKVELLSGEDNQNIYCKGIAEVHFNAWSYMDANLWAGIVTKIFERLNLYIKDEKISDAKKKEIKAEIAKKLSITSETIETLEKEKKELVAKIGTLTEDKEKLVTRIDTNIDAIRKSTLADVLKQINISFNVEENIDDAIKKNKSYVQTKEQLAALIPTEHWKDPINLYQELKSNRTLFRQFFMKETWRKNWGWLLFIAAIIILTPIGLAILSQYIKNFDFTVPEELWYTLSSISAVLLGLFRSYKKLSPLIASFWKIKNEYNQKIKDYEKEKEVAIFEFEQNEKALRLEIEDSRAKIQQIDQDIEQSKELEKSLEDRINKTLSTETLYNFIEKKALSNDYKQYLGIVSIIRKDFEILSELFADSRDEKEKPKTEKEKKKHKEIVSFRKRFKKPLERIILYVDDLDRCSEERVVEVLEAVNLLMAFPLFIVVVGVDPRWVKIALEAKYQKQFTLNTEEEGLRVSPSNYLEKIFQIPFRLKSAEDRTVKSMLKSLAEKKVSLASQGETAMSATPENPSGDHPGGKMTGTKTIVTLEEPADKNITIDNPDETPGQGNIAEIEIVEEPEQKEKIESLEFSKKEVELIQNMSCVIGSNPRAIKRFVNIYRVIKAHDIFNYNPDHQNHEILADLFLIALPLGTFRSLVPSFLTFLNENRNYSIKTYLNRSIPKQADTAQAKEYQARKDLIQELNNKGKDILDIKKEHFNREHIEFIKRFYFN